MFQSPLPCHFKSSQANDTKASKRIYLACIVISAFSSPARSETIISLSPDSERRSPLSLALSGAASALPTSWEDTGNAAAILFQPGFYQVGFSYLRSENDIPKMSALSPKKGNSLQGSAAGLAYGMFGFGVSLQQSLFQRERQPDASLKLGLHENWTSIEPAVAFRLTEDLGLGYSQNFDTTSVTLKKDFEVSKSSSTSNRKFSGNNSQFSLFFILNENSAFAAKYRMFSFLQAESDPGFNHRLYRPATASLAFVTIFSPWASAYFSNFIISTEIDFVHFPHTNSFSGLLILDSYLKETEAEDWEPTQSQMSDPDNTLDTHLKMTPRLGLQTLIVQRKGFSIQALTGTSLMPAMQKSDESRLHISAGAVVKVFILKAMAAFDVSKQGVTQALAFGVESSH